jgi:tRNA pseudouridine55 synthase
VSGRVSVPSRVVLVDKPAGWTSFDVVRRARRGVKEKVGHAGTLDPFATGLLLVLVGQATRVSSLMMELPKEYRVSVRFGATSTTGDPTGEITETRRRTGAKEVLGALDSLRGRISQRVPMTSAVKVGGEALYRKAHRGEQVETPVREVDVYDLTLLEFDEQSQVADILALTGKGTYIRTLAEDLGVRVETGAYAAALRRTRVGAFTVDQAVDPDALFPELYQEGASAVRSLSSALDFLPSHELSPEQVPRARNGNEVYGTPGGRLRVYGPEGLLAVYEGPAGVARPLVVFSAPQV